MKIEGINGLEFRDRSFLWAGRDYPYDSVTAISFAATVTRNRINPDTYEAELDVRLGDKHIRIEPQRGWFGKLKKGGMEALQRANSVLSQLTFAYRIVPYEEQFEKAGFFSFGGIQFHKDGHVFRAGEQVGKIGETLSFDLYPFQLNIMRKEKSLGAKLASAFISRDIAVDLTTNRDCMLYMLKRVYGVAWKREFIPEKLVDREKLFYETVLRFGAMLAKVDGSATPSELMQLKRFFNIDDANIPEAGKIFNEALAASATIEAVLAPFAKEYKDAAELKETFLVGMLSVALADGVFDQREFDLIRRASQRLGMSASAFERILATAGLSSEEFDSRSEEKSSGRERRKSSSASGGARAVHLRVLELSEGASKDEIRAAYRTLVRRYHPDALQGQGVPKEEIAKAEAILVQINLAYEALMAERA